MEFTESNIQKLFGHEAAENEDPGRLQEYYFKSSVYERIVTDLPLRIIVGHKGTGKSALLQMAMQEDSARGLISIFIRPNDVAGIGVNVEDFIQTIRSWTEGLSQIIVQKSLQHFNIANSKGLSMKYEGRGILSSISDILNSPDQDTIQRIDTEKALRFIENPRLIIYIDDLDRGWSGLHIDITRISALLNSVRDLTNQDRGLSFRIALRSDVYYLVRTSDESTDKIEGSVVWHSWINHEIFVLLVKRIETYFGRQVNEKILLSTHQRDLAKYLSQIMEPTFKGRGHWSNAPMYKVLMSLIRRRPRDLVKLCSLAARNAYVQGSAVIRTPHLEAGFEEYSQGRIQDTINEYRSELPSIERLLMNMKPNRRERTAKAGYTYRTDLLLEKIRNIMESGQFKLANGRIASERDLAGFLYKINFLTARKESDDGILRKYFEENRYLSSPFADFGFDWEIHPAYRWALQPADIDQYLPALNSDDT